MGYPAETITTTKTGKKEVRVLIGEGKYVMYKYRDIEGKDIQKYSVLLEKENGEIEHIMIVPTKDREIVVKHAVEKPFVRGIWDDKDKKVVRFP